MRSSAWHFLRLVHSVEQIGNESCRIFMRNNYIILANLEIKNINMQTKPKDSYCCLLLMPYLNFDYFQELITKTSKYAAKINKEQTSLSVFQVKVPRHWDFSVCSGPSGQRRTTYARPSQSTDIIIGRNHPVFGTQPWTLQNRGCGQKGLIINLPYSFLLKTTQNSSVKGMLFNTTKDVHKY